MRQKVYDCVQNSRSGSLQGDIKSSARPQLPAMHHWGGDTPHIPGEPGCLPSCKGAIVSKPPDAHCAFSILTAFTAYTSVRWCTTAFITCALVQ